MRKQMFILAAIFCALISCSGTDSPVPPVQGDEQKTLIVFDNSQGITTAIVYDDHRRRDEDKIVEVPAGQRSLAIAWEPGESTFFFAYIVQLKGMDISLTYVAGVGQNQTTVPINADETTPVFIPRLEGTLSSPYALLSEDAYLFIQNNSFGTFSLHRGNSEVRPDGVRDSAIVNHGINARYTITPGAASGYLLLVGGDTVLFPNPPANFEAGRVYNFTFDGSIRLTSEVDVKLENAAITAPVGSRFNPIPLAAGTWADGSITASTSGGEVWYSFNVTAGTTYYLWWNDVKQGNSTRTLDIVVDAVYSLSGTSIFTGEDSAWESPKAFTADANGTVKVRVAPYSAGGMGTYSIVWSTDDNVVTFNANGGIFSAGGDTVTKGVPPGQAAGALPALQARTGYTFLGWSTSPGGPVNFTASTVVSGGRTVYAQWAAHAYTVTFDNNGGTGINPTTRTVTYPATMISALPTEPTRTGHTFAGWNAAANGSDTVFTASYAFNTAASSGSLTVYAQWAAHMHTVTFDNNGGTGVTPTTRTVAFPATTISALPTEPTRANYTFVGWNTAANGSGTIFTAAHVFNTTASGGVLTVFAQWTLNTWTVRFDNNGGTGVTPTMSTVTFPATMISALPTEPTRTGHTFAGWNTQANGNGTAFTAEHVFNTAASGGSLTVFAQWMPITYTVVYNGNGHTGGSMTDSVHTYGVGARLTPNGFTRTGHTFTGWDTQANGTGAAYSPWQMVWDLRSTPGTVTLYAQWTAINITSTLPGGVALAMRWMPAGSFMMGSPTTEEGRWDDEGPRHLVTLTRGFYMGIYPVTQEQYAAVMTGNANGLNASPRSFFGSPAAGEVQARRPVEMVSWYDALVFCNRLSILEGLTPVYSINGSTNPANWGTVPTSRNATWDAVTVNWNANGYRLPTEAEWEYACRAGTTTAWYTGRMESALLQAAAWYSVNSSGRTREVGLKTPNAWGLYDMHGNVFEWCWDWHDAYTAGAKTDPRGPSAGADRVNRGGSWGITAAELLRSAQRSYSFPSSRFNVLGFRVVRYQ